MFIYNFIKLCHKNLLVSLCNYIIGIYLVHVTIHYLVHATIHLLRTCNDTFIENIFKKVSATAHLTWDKIQHKNLLKLYNCI